MKKLLIYLGTFILLAGCSEGTNANKPNPRDGFRPDGQPPMPMHHRPPVMEGRYRCSFVPDQGPKEHRKRPHRGANGFKPHNKLGFREKPSPNQDDLFKQGFKEGYKKAMEEQKQKRMHKNSAAKAKKRGNHPPKRAVDKKKKTNTEKK